jgi:hypothetical protein
MVVAVLTAAAMNPPDDLARRISLLLRARLGAPQALAGGARAADEGPARKRRAISTARKHDDAIHDHC